MWRWRSRSLLESANVIDSFGGSNIEKNSILDFELAMQLSRMRGLTSSLGDVHTLTIDPIRTTLHRIEQTRLHLDHRQEGL